MIAISFMLHTVKDNSYLKQQILKGSKVMGDKRRKQKNLSEVRVNQEQNHIEKSMLLTSFPAFSPAWGLIINLFLTH